MGVEKKIEKAEKEAEREFILNVPNSLTLLRLLLMFVIAFLIWINYSFLIIGIIFIIAALTDYFDGYFARKLNQKSDLGARLDQVIDRVFMIPLVLLLLFKLYNFEHTFAFLLIACLSREIIGLPGFVIRLIRNKDAYKVKYIGKVVTFVQSVAVTLIIFAIWMPVFTPLAWIASIATGLVGILAGFDYLKDSLM